MLRGLDYVLLPDFLKDLLQPVGYESMIVERDSWFKSPACFIRDGADCLLALDKQQQIGLDLLATFEQGGGSKYDDYISSQNPLDDTKPKLGSSRRHIGHDQAMRAGNLFVIHEPAFDASGLSIKGSPPGSLTHKTPFGQAIPHVVASPSVAAELSDTDNEEHQQKRRRSAHGRGRRRHLLSPSTARTRVMLSQSRQSSNFVKTEQISWGNVPIRDTQFRSPTDALDDQKPPPSLGIVRESLKEDFKPSKPASRFRVDSLHLAALMAVGTTPPSSP
jgi:hypothetical protein